MQSDSTVWDAKPPSSTTSIDPINWVELKTAATPHSDRDILKYERKLLKFWIQSFLLGVPKIIVGFRSRDGILERLEEMETAGLPKMVKQRGKGTWDGNVCINFTANFLECESTLPPNFSFLLICHGSFSWRMFCSKKGGTLADALTLKG